MYNIIKNVINSRDYELSAILRKVDTLWIQERITDEQKDELCSFARENAEFAKSVDVLEKLKELETRLSALENKEDSEEYAAFESGKWYYGGDRVNFGDKNYLCIAPEGAVCTWSPSEYPDFWQQIQ